MHLSPARNDTLMLILGFESSCDETAAAVVQVDGGRFTALSSVVRSQVDVHRLYGGVVPEIASRAHTEALTGITREALRDAGVSLPQIDCVAVANHPGLIGALLTGVNFAKALAVRNKIPLVAVDHIRGHIAAAYLLESPPAAPFLAIVVSGGHTSLYLVGEKNRARLIGETRDDAIGEAFDKIGRRIGIPYPAGRGFDALSRKGFAAMMGDAGDGDYVGLYHTSPVRRSMPYLPSPYLAGEEIAFSFSGLKTAAINLLHRYEQTGEAFDAERFAAHYTYTVVEGVADALRDAFRRYGAMDVVLAGGVAANSHLRRRIACIAAEEGKKAFLLPPALCGDNAAMIAAEGYFRAAEGAFADASLNASAADGE